MIADMKFTKELKENTIAMIRTSGSLVPWERTNANMPLSIFFNFALCINLINCGSHNYHVSLKNQLDTQRSTKMNANSARSGILSMVFCHKRSCTLNGLLDKD